MKIISDFEIMQKLMVSQVFLETEWTDLLSNERSLRNSIENEYLSNRKTSINGLQRSLFL